MLKFHYNIDESGSDLLAEYTSLPSTVFPLRRMYEGGWKIWEYRLDLAAFLRGEGTDSYRAGVHGKRVLEVSVPSIVRTAPCAH